MTNPRGCSGSLAGVGRLRQPDLIAMSSSAREIGSVRDWRFVNTGGAISNRCHPV